MSKINKLNCTKFKEFVKGSLIGTQHEWESHIENMFRLFDRNLKGHLPSNLLDVGCGDGSRTIRIAEYFDIDTSRVYGIDKEGSYLEECRNSLNTQKLDLECENIPHSNDSFDLVICNQVLEHLKNYKKVIDELIRVTKKEAYLLVGIPNLAHLINRIYLLFGVQPMCIDIDSSHVRGFTHSSFVKMLESSQTIKLIDFEGALMYPLPFFLGKALAHRFVGLSGYVCYLLKKI
jgi:ubiquinone/menaquinone biosynthesis C-methylase UbiE